MLKKSVEWMFSDTQATSRREVFRWWEARRPIYNALLLPVGIVTWLLVLFAGSHAVKPGEDFEEPLMMIVGPPLYAIMANICYTVGPFFDATFCKEGSRVKLFKLGLLFSLCLTAAPGVWAVLAWLITIYTGRKL